MRRSGRFGRASVVGAAYIPVLCRQGCIHPGYFVDKVAFLENAAFFLYVIVVYFRHTNDMDMTSVWSK